MGNRKSSGFGGNSRLVDDNEDPTGSDQIKWTECFLHAKLEKQFCAGGLLWKGKLYAAQGD